MLHVVPYYLLLPTYFLLLTAYVANSILGWGEFILPLLMQQRHISYLLERLTISILAFYKPNIYSLHAKLPFVIAIPWDIDVVGFKDKYPQPVKDLQLIVDHLLPDRREEELVNLCASGR